MGPAVGATAPVDGEILTHSGQIRNDTYWQTSPKADVAGLEVRMRGLANRPPQNTTGGGANRPSPRFPGEPHTTQPTP